MEQRSPEWFEARKGKITGSRVGAILGVNPYKTRDEVMREMVREHFGAEREFTGNAATNHGERLEPKALAFYRTMLEDCVDGVDEVGFIPHPTIPYIGASPDGILRMKPDANARGGLEIKCPYWAKEAYSVHDEAKASYAAQCQLVMECCQLDYMDFLCFFNQDDYLLETIERDYDWWKEAEPKLAEFHAKFLHIIANKKRAAPYLADLKQPDPVIDDPRMRELAGLFLRISASNARLKDAQARFDSLKKELAAEFGKGTGDGVRFELQLKKGPMDWEKLCQVLDVEAQLAQRGQKLDDYRKPDTASVLVQPAKEDAR